MHQTALMLMCSKAPKRIYVLAVSLSSALPFLLPSREGGFVEHGLVKHLLSPCRHAQTARQPVTIEADPLDEKFDYLLN